MLKTDFLQISPMMCGVILEERISWFVGEIKPDTISLVWFGERWAIQNLIQKKYYITVVEYVGL